MHKAPDVAHAPAVPVATAVLAVLASIGSVISNHTATEALNLKNDAILARSRSSDAYTSYEAHQVREEIYAATLAGGNPDTAARTRLSDVVTTEREKATESLGRAKESAQVSEGESERSERLTHAHNLFDVAIALIEVAVAIISISALASSWYLAGFAGVCALAGVVVGVFAQLSR